MNYSNIDSKPVVFQSDKKLSFNSFAQKTRFARNKFVLTGAALVVVGATLIPNTIYAWAPQPYCRSGQTVMVAYDEANHHYKTQEGDVAGACPSPTSTPTPTPTPTPTAAPCVTTDLKGTLEHGDNHETTNPVTGHLENISDNSNCTDTLWIDIYGSTHKQHEDEGWLESQKFVAQQKIEVPKGKKDITIEVPNQDFCWYQVDVVRNSDIKVPPRFDNTQMIDYAFVKDQDSCDTASPTPTPSAQGTVVINNTNNNTNNNTTNVTVVSPSSSPQVIAAAVTPATELPKTGLPLAGLALGGLTPIGMKLKKFRSTKEAMSANFIWENRQLSK